LLNLLTLSGTVVVLAVLSVPALLVLGQSSASGPGPAQSAANGRLFGIALDPWHVDDWSRAVGAKPQLVAKFEAFSRRGSLKPYMAEAERQGVRALMLSWEPWRPVPAAQGRTAQFKPQPGYRNADIARGAQDAYITRVARTLATFHGVVYLRYAHEMNGIWYPWTHDSRSYRLAWRRVVGLVRRAGATNVRFVWSANPNLYETPAAWLKRLERYWPGRRYVDAVGSTTIDFGGRKDYSIARFEPRLIALHRHFRKPLLITEANTDYVGRVQWLRAFRDMLRRAPWIRAVVWSQLPSRGKAQMPGAGVLDWDVQRHPTAAAVLRQIILDGSGGTEARPPPQGPRSALP
jgi:hypothetical protein